MAKKENEIESPQPKELPMIKKVVDCPRCGAKIEVEFEIDLEALIPATIADVLSIVGQPVKEDDKD